MSKFKSKFNLFLFSSSGLLTGFAIYYWVRPGSQVYFLSAINITGDATYPAHNVFGIWGDCLPSLLHTFSFILLSAVFCSMNKKRHIFLCVFWIVVNVIFELAQKYDSFVFKIIPDWFSSVFILENIKPYCINGSFDPFDLLASFAGGIIAYFILKGEIKYESDIKCL